MASESVEILIEADDQASAKVEKAAENVERQIKRVKTVGGQAKASTEFIGTLANSLGNSQVGGFAGDLAQLTERISAFSEVSAAGGAGAMAFKAGLAAAAGVLAFQVGQAIGNIVFDTEKWADELKRAGDEAARVQQELVKSQDKRFGQKREDLGLIRDDGHRETETNSEASRLEKEASLMEGRIALAQKQINDRRLFNEGAGKYNRNSSEILKQEEAQLQVIKDRQKALRDEASALRESVGERQKMLEAQRAENAALDKQDAFLAGLREEVTLLKANAEERRQIEAAKNTTDDPEARGEAEALLAERDALLAKAEAEKLAEQEREAAKRKEEAEAERIANLQQREVERLHERRLAIEQGAEAAKAYSLEQQGLDAIAAKSLAAQEAEIKQLEEATALKKEMANFQPGTQAVQGRLLTRGPAERGIDKIAAASEKQVNLLDEIKVVLQNPPNNNSNKIVMVGS